jgi:hypothetical protein
VAAVTEALEVVEVVGLAAAMDRHDVIDFDRGRFATVPEADLAEWLLSQLHRAQRLPRRAVVYHALGIIGPASIVLTSPRAVAVELADARTGDSQASASGDAARFARKPH